MSQYILGGKDEGNTCLVGWDPPMNTFFCQVFDAKDVSLFWVGSKCDEIQDVEYLMQVISEWAHSDWDAHCYMCISDWDESKDAKSALESHLLSDKENDR